jgi:DNA-binding HxlR family transcriptional regulator
MKKSLINGQPIPVARMVEDIVGCKWSIAVLGLVRQGINRPGAMEHAIEGLSAKVLNERLRKLMHFGILAKRIYAQVPPRVEYELTPFGARFGALLDEVDALQAQLSAQLSPSPAPRAAPARNRASDRVARPAPARRSAR